MSDVSVETDGPDPGFRLTRPRGYRWRALAFIALVLLMGAVLAPRLVAIVAHNATLNVLILSFLAGGLVFAVLQILRLEHVVAWVNRRAGGDMSGSAPRLMAPIAFMLDSGRPPTLGPLALRAILDSVGARLEEQREILRYMMGLLIFLGLLGTFWGLLETVTAVGGAIGGIEVDQGDPSAVFDRLRAGLEGPMQGMGTSFSASLFGLSSSLILGFLDLQVGQAQNRFYNELEEWLSLATDFQQSGATDERLGERLAQTLDRLEALERSLAVRAAEAQHPNLAPNVQDMAALAEAARGVQARMMGDALASLARIEANLQDAEPPARFSRLADELDRASEALRRGQALIEAPARSGPDPAHV